MKSPMMWNTSLLLLNLLSELLNNKWQQQDSNPQLTICKWTHNQWPHKIKIECHNDNHSLYNSLIRPRQDKHLQTQTTFLKQMLNKIEATNLIGMEKYQITNYFTKNEGSSDALLNTIKTKSIVFL